MQMQVIENLTRLLADLDESLLDNVDRYAEIGLNAPSCVAQTVLDSGENRILVDLYKASKADPELAKELLKKEINFYRASAILYSELFDQLNNLFETDTSSQDK